MSSTVAGDLELGRLEVPVHAAVLPLGELPVDEQPQALLEAEPLVVGMAALFGRPWAMAEQVQGERPSVVGWVSMVVSFQR